MESASKWTEKELYKLGIQFNRVTKYKDFFGEDESEDFFAHFDDTVKERLSKRINKIINIAEEYGETYLDGAKKTDDDMILSFFDDIYNVTNVKASESSVDLLAVDLFRIVGFNRSQHIAIQT